MQGLPRPEDTGDGSLPSLRVGFTVTKRAGHATERNRMRRRLRAAALEALGSHSGVAIDVVVIARRPVLTSEYRVLVADLERAVGVVTKTTTTKRTSRPPLS